MMHLLKRQPLNQAFQAGLGVGINACTDITGFGMLGHTLEMAKGANVHIEIRVADLPVLNGV